MCNSSKEAILKATLKAILKAILKSLRFRSSLKTNVGRSLKRITPISRFLTQFWIR